jgi:Galactose-3-O-sulfotransferase
MHERDRATGADDVGIGHGRRMSKEDPTVIFLHIGKTAGTTMRQVLRRSFRGSDIMVVRVRERPREETLERFAALPSATRARPRLIMGHTVFGLHEYVPRPSTYISMLRKPKDLVISQYRYVLRTRNHRHHGVVDSEHMSIEEYIRSGISTEMDNSQTRAIAGDLATPYGECSDEMLERAKRNIESSFAVVGLTERFDQSLVLLQHAFGWSHLNYVRANVSPNRDPVELTSSALALIEEHNRLDDELYRYVTDRFDHAIARIPSFENDLAEFERANSRYRPLGVISQLFPHRMASKMGLSRLRSRTRAPGL